MIIYKKNKYGDFNDTGFTFHFDFSSSAYGIKTSPSLNPRYSWVILIVSIPIPAILFSEALRKSDSQEIAHAKVPCLSAIKFARVIPIPGNDAKVSFQSGRPNA